MLSASLPLHPPPPVSLLLSPSLSLTFLGLPLLSPALFSRLPHLPSYSFIVLFLYSPISSFSPFTPLTCSTMRGVRRGYWRLRTSYPRLGKPAWGPGHPTLHLSLHLFRMRARWGGGRACWEKQGGGSAEALTTSSLHRLKALTVAPPSLPQPPKETFHLKRSALVMQIRILGRLCRPCAPLPQPWPLSAP